MLKVVYENKKPSEESYVAEVDKKTGKKKEAVVEKIKCKETSLIKKVINKNSLPEMEEYINYSPPDSRTSQYRLKNVGETEWIEELNYQRLRDTFAVMCLQAGGYVYSVAYVMGVGTGAVYDRYGKWMVKDYEFKKIY